ncbi:MAG TPA: glycoside hydrolase family 15 protein [Myxococcaceae bacterium]|nr:glycoside hydrolase family 15 protein [Myxococcaceae bacterium]
MRIEDYAVLGDMQTTALVGRDGSIDWLCLPRFDSGACFAALLGDADHGRWRLGPVEPASATHRRYRPSTLILETDFETRGGRMRITDFMPPRQASPEVIRIVEGVQGQVAVRMELVIRFDYGSIVPWVRNLDGVLYAIGGSDALHLHTPIATHGEGLRTVAEFVVSSGDRIPFVLAWSPSHLPMRSPTEPERALRETETWWKDWSGRCAYEGPYVEQVRRSLITLKALTYAPTAGIVAAPTTSLPEKLGGSRNWDYRSCWLRDATFTLYSLMTAGYRDEARAWRDWLLRAVAGDPTRLQITYGLAGERRLPEFVLDHLPGYEGSAPVRIGNAAARQLQLDVYGEVMDTLHQARRVGVEDDGLSWNLQEQLLGYLETGWNQPDNGIWEVRGPRRHFTHSKVMAWVAVDRAVKDIEMYGLESDVDRWKGLRDAIHEEVCKHGFDPRRGSFVQYFGGRELDASLLMIPLVGFLPPQDVRVHATVEAIARNLCEDGFVRRYDANASGCVDGLPPGEGVFLACTFWLADNYWLLGRHEEARRLFETLLGVANDVGLLSEQYDPVSRRLLGNFPQAFSHVSLVNTAFNLSSSLVGPAAHRMRRKS